MAGHRHEPSEEASRMHHTHDALADNSHEYAEQIATDLGEVAVSGSASVPPIDNPETPRIPKAKAIRYYGYATEPGTSLADYKP